MSRSMKEQRDALDTYKRKMSEAQQTGESAQGQYERLKEEYQAKVWKEANRGEAEEEK